MSLKRGKENIPPPGTYEFSLDTSSNEHLVRDVIVATEELRSEGVQSDGPANINIKEEIPRNTEGKIVFSSLPRTLHVTVVGAQNIVRFDERLKEVVITRLSHPSIARRRLNNLAGGRP